MSADVFDSVDVFDAPSAGPEKGALITGGRYRIPNRDGSHRKGGLMRVTNLAGAMSDQRALQLWGERQVALGLRARVDLYEELCTLPVHKLNDTQLREAVQPITDRAKEAAKSDAGARRGTARHDMVEIAHRTGERVGTPEMLGQLDQYLALLELHRLTAVDNMQERVIVCEALGVAGRLDNMYQCLLNGTTYIGDLKTHKGFYSWLEIAIQLACYAHADYIYNPDDGTFEDFPRVDLSTAIVSHVPSIGDPVQLYEINIEQGWKFAQVASQVCAIRSLAKSKRGGIGRPRPVPVVWPERIKAVTTREQGVALVAEMRAAGAFTPEMAALARDHAATLPVLEKMPA